MGLAECILLVNTHTYTHIHTHYKHFHQRQVTKLREALPKMRRVENQRLDEIPLSFLKELTIAYLLLFYSNMLANCLPIKKTFMHFSHTMFLCCHQAMTLNKPAKMHSENSDRIGQEVKTLSECKQKGWISIGYQGKAWSRIATQHKKHKARSLALVMRTLLCAWHQDWRPSEQLCQQQLLKAVVVTQLLLLLLILLP